MFVEWVLEFENPKKHSSINFITKHLQKNIGHETGKNYIAQITSKKFMITK